MIFPYHAGGLEFTDKFVKDIDSYNYNFRSIGDQDTAEQAIQLGLTNIIDDMTKSGSTLLKSREIVLKQGAKDVGLVVLHVTPVMNIGEDLLANLVEKSGRKVVTSNTVYTSTFCEKFPDLMYNVTDDLVDTLQE